jgi:hypothetical protein
MKRHFRFFISFFLIIFIAITGLINLRLHHEPEIKVIEGNAVNFDELSQLRYLGYAMEQQHAATEMQHRYPEGYLFFNALYGLSWSELAQSLDKNSILFQEASVEIQRAFNHVNSEEGKIIFDSSLPLPYGAFYNGWANYLLGRKLTLESINDRADAEVVLFKTRCNQISQVIQKQTYPESYYGSAWPADAVVCVATLALHDRIFPPLYGNVIQNWVKEVKARFDQNGHIPHRVHHATGKSIEEARGSSLSLMLCFLPEIDQSLAKSQFKFYQQDFSKRFFGLYGIQEYLHEDNSGDVDSGPVIFGFGSSATIVGMRAMHINGEVTEAYALRSEIEAFGFPVKSDGRKKYLFGKLPMADVFISWAQSAFHKKTDTHHLESRWRTEFHWYSAIISIVFISLLTWWWFDDLKKQWKKLARRK